VEQPFDDTAKTYFRRFFERQGMRAISQFEVFSRSRTIDLIVECTIADQHKLTDTVFEHFRRLNALEFKGVHDPLTAIDLNRIMMRAWGLGAVELTEQATDNGGAKKLPFSSAQEIAEAPHQRTVTIVCVQRPAKVLDVLSDAFHFTATAEPGVYWNNVRDIPIWIIYPTELDIKPKNYPLLALARSTKLETFITLCLQQGLVEYLQLALDVGLVTDPNVIWQKIMEVYGMELTIHEETWPYIDEFFRKVPDAMRKVPSFQEALAESQRQGALKNQQQTLLRLLRHKFGKVPEAVVKQIEATDNSDQLNHWLEQVLDVTSLSDMSF
jgi:hypothetical protein